MKTNFATNRKNEKQGTTLKSAVIAATLVITGMAASAQGLWGTFSANSHETVYANAGLAVKNYKTVNSDAATLASFSAYLVEESEEVLEVEKWMIEIDNFGRFIEIEEETESPLELEEWMLNDKSFAVKNEKEEPLKIEAWMTAENVWK
ncbi:MAG: hypothetical protein ACOC13_03415 [Tangfeifania sp.]